MDLNIPHSLPDGSQLQVKDEGEDTISAEELKRSALKEDVLKAIAPYLHPDTKPPFSATELLVIAAISCGAPCQGASKREMYSWILKTFLYYTFQAAQEIMEQTIFDDVHCDETPATDLIDALQDAFKDWTFPLRGTVDRGSDRASSITSGAPFRYCVTPHQGRAILSAYLEPSRRGTFDFMGLPAEVRVYFYEILFAFKDVRVIPTICLGYRPNPHSSSRPFRSLKRFIVTGSDYLDYGKQLPNASDMFALLCVSKTIFQEAMPIFYVTNRFSFEGRYWATDALQTIPTSRLQNLKNVRIKIDATGSLLSRDTPLGRLAAKTRPKELEIDFGSAEWLDSMATSHSDISGDLDDTQPTGLVNKVAIQALIALAAKANKVVFSGNSESLKVYIRAEAEKLRNTEELPEILELENNNSTT